MNSSRSPKRTRNAAAAFALLLSSVAGQAFAQQAPAVPPLDANRVIEANTNPEVPGIAPPRAPVAPLPIDVTLGEANERVKAMSSEADQALDAIVGDALSSDRGSQTVEDLAKVGDRILLLEKKLEEAKLAVDLRETVLGKDQRADEKIKDLETEKADMLAELTKLREQVSKQAMETRRTGSDPDPVVAEITGAAGSVKAKILIPYLGEVMATVGDVLPNGQKIASISTDGVKVRRTDGSLVTLGFGTQVPSTRPASFAGAGVAGQQSQ